MIFIGCKSNKNQDSSIVKVENTSSKVFFKNLNNGDTVQSPVTVEMGVRGMKIKPAGKLEAGTGHHHIILDSQFVQYGEIIPMDKTHLHYGKGDTVASVPLEKGEPMYILCDNESAVNNASKVESVLNEKHSSVAYNYV